VASEKTAQRKISRDTYYDGEYSFLVALEDAK